MKRAVGYAALAAYVATIPVANWMIGHVGTICLPHGPCLIPVAPGILAPSGADGLGNRCRATWGWCPDASPPRLAALLEGP